MQISSLIALLWMVGLELLFLVRLRHAS